MRKAHLSFFLAIVALLVFTLPASADTVTFSGSGNGTLSSSSSSISVDMWMTTSNVGFPSETLNFNISGKTVAITNIFSTSFAIGDLTANDCDFSANATCEVDILGGSPFAMNSTFFTTLGISGPNKFTLSGFIQGQDLSNGQYSVSSWGVDAVQATPEPGSMLLLASGLMGALRFRRKLIR